MKIVILLMSLVLLYVAPVDAANNAKKFTCGAVPQLKKNAIKKAGRYFSEGDKFVENEEYLKAMDRYLCSLKMAYHPNTLTNINSVADLAVNKKPILQSLKKFRNRNGDHEATPDINELVDTLETPEEPPLEIVKEPKVEESKELPDERFELIDKKFDQHQQFIKGMTAGSVTLGAGFMFAGAGIAFTVLGVGEKSLAKETGDPDEEDAHNSQKKKYIVLSSVSYSMALIGVITGAVLIHQSKKRVNVNISHNSISLSGTF